MQKLPLAFRERGKICSAIILRLSKILVSRITNVRVVAAATQRACIIYFGRFPRVFTSTISVEMKQKMHTNIKWTVQMGERLRKPTYLFVFCRGMARLGARDFTTVAVQHRQSLEGQLALPCPSKYPTRRKTQRRSQRGYVSLSPSLFFFYLPSLPRLRTRVSLHTHTSPIMRLQAHFIYAVRPFLAHFP